MDKSLIILTEGYSDPFRAKTAVNLLRYRTKDVAAVFDTKRRGSRCETVFGIGGDIPIIGSFDESPSGETLLIGIAPSGGRLPAAMRPVVLEAISRGMGIVSGLHEFLCADSEIAQLAEQHGVSLWDVRKNNECEVAQRAGIDERCLRIQTVGQDCNVGKMVVSLELSLALRNSGWDAKFVATGQTGIMIEGDGCPIDAVLGDFLSGAAERLVLANQHHQILLIEGQGSLGHPRFSAVTLGLLHGAIPDGLILCYEMGREFVSGMDKIRLKPLPLLKRVYEDASNLMHPCEVIGIAVNGRRFSDSEIASECERVSAECGVPASDVLRHGPQQLMDAMLSLKKRLGK